MSKLPLVLSPTAGPSKPGLDARATYREAYAMARRMLKDRRTSTVAASWTWFLGHARRRFTTPLGWRIAQLAGRAVSARRPPPTPPPGAAPAPPRRGLARRPRRPRLGNLLGVVPYRCARVDRVRSVGLTFAWSADPLASSGNRGLRLARAVRLREDRARRAEVARAMAADRYRIERGPFFTITDLGRAVLADATAHV